MYLLCRSIAIAKPELTLERSKLSKMWKSSLQRLESTCLENISILQNTLSSQTNDDKIKWKKKKVLIQAFLMIEVNNLKIVKELLSCKCMESASELWAGRYQLRFQYKKADRYRYSPINISLG